MSALTIQYKPGYYINISDRRDIGFSRVETIEAVCSPSGYGGEQLGTFKSLHAAKLAITRHIKARELDEFVKGYMACALWSSNDESTESGGAPMDENYDIDDIAPQTAEAMRSDCADFMKSNSALIVQYCKARKYDPSQGSVLQYVGHDFWLTRCGHGCGFWDRGLGELGDKLTEKAHTYGNVDLYVGDDGKIYA